MIFRVEKTKEYTIMSNHHLREKDMSLKAKGLLSWMLSNDDDWDYSIQGIVACCKENETAIESALDELKKFGYLTITKLLPNQTESGRIEYIYDIHEKPKQEIEKQEVDFLPLEIQPLENQVQRNTITRNTKEEIKNNNTILKNNTAEPSLDNSETKNIKPKRRILLNDDFSSKGYDTAKEEKKQTKRLNMYDKCILEIDNYTDDDKLKEALKSYLSIRLKMTDKKLLGVNQFKGLLKTLSDLNGDKVAIVERATERGWASFYELKDYQYSNRNNYRKTDCSVFGETPQMRSVSPEEVEGGESSGIIF